MITYLLPYFDKIYISQAFMENFPTTKVMLHTVIMVCFIFVD